MKFVDYLSTSGNTISKEQILIAHKWILKHLEDERNILPIRATGTFSDRGSECKACKHRARKVLLSESNRNIVFCDNELAVWLFREYSKFNFPNISLNDLLTQRQAPVADSRAKRESDGAFLLEVVARPWGTTKTHNHIFDAGIPRKADNSKFSLELLISKSVRLIHPLNHFLFPTDLNFKAEQNDRPEFQFVAAEYMRRKIGDKIFNEFIKLVCPHEIQWPDQWQEQGKKYYNTLLVTKDIRPPAVQRLQANPTSTDQERQTQHIIRLPEDVQCEYKMNKTFKDQRELSTRKIPRKEGITDYTLNISWHIPEHPGQQHIGKFSFNLEELSKARVITINASNEYIFTIKRKDNGFWLGDEKLPSPT